MISLLTDHLVELVAALLALLEIRPHAPLRRSQIAMQARERKSEGDLHHLAACSADGMAFRYVYAGPHHRLRARLGRKVDPVSTGRVEVRVVAPGHVGEVFGPKRYGKRERIYLSPGTYVTACDAWGAAVRRPHRVRGV